MDKFQSKVDTPAAKMRFHHEYSVANDVTFSLAMMDAKQMGTKSTVAFPIASIVEGSLRFLLDASLHQLFHPVMLTSMQVSINVIRIVCGISTLNHKLRLNLEIWDIFHCNGLFHSKDYSTYYLCVWLAELHLVTKLFDKGQAQ
mgnify:CR=1 FL=1